MATTPKGIYYPDDYSAAADIPSDMEDMAESIDTALGNTEETIDGQIEDIQTEQTTQNSQIEALQIENARLKATLPTTTGTGSNITLDKTAEMYFAQPPLPKGNTTQQTYTGYNMLGLVDGTYSSGGITAVVSNGEVTLSGTGTNTPVMLEIPMKQNITISSNFYLYAFNKTTAGESSAGGNQNYVALRMGINGNDNRAQITFDETNKKASFTQSSEITFTKCAIRSNENVTLSNFVIKPMLALANNLDYEPYVGGTASPNPSYPQTVKTVTGNANVLVQNKNLLPNANKYNETNINITRCNVSIDNNEFVFTATSGTSFYLGRVGAAGLAFEDAWGSLMAIPDGATKIYLKITNDEFNDRYINFYDENKISLGYSTITNNIAIPNNAKYCTVRIGKNNSVSGTIYRTKIMVSTIDTDYVPYLKQDLPLTLGSIELCKIGDYQDYIYKDNGKWYKYGAIGKVVLDGSETWTSITSGNLYYITNTGIKLQSSVTNAVPIFSNNFNSYAYQDLYTANVDYGISSHTSDRLCIRHKDETSIADFKSWLGTHNTSVYYPLATPTTTEITDSTLKSQLEAILNSYSYEEQTNISGSSAGANPIFSVEAYQSLKLVLAS